MCIYIYIYKYIYIYIYIYIMYVMAIYMEQKVLLYVISAIRLRQGS